MRCVPSIALSCAVLALAATLSSAANAQSYAAVDLGDLGARGLNDLGQVAGVIYGAQGSQAAYTGANGQGLTVLSMPFSGQGAALGINNQGLVFGTYFTPDGTVSPSGNNFGGFVAAPGSTSGQVVTTDMGTVDGITAVNSSGQMAGWVGPSSVVFNPTTGQSQVVTGLTYSLTTGMNDQGMVVGQAQDANTYTDSAFVADAEGNAHLIKSLGDSGSEAFDINNHGWIVGGTRINYGWYHAFLSKDGQSFVELLPNASFSSANAINDAGVIVGDMEDANGQRRAFVTGADGQGVFDLNLFAQLPSNALIIAANAINESGQILVMGSDYHSYLLTPTVPEPGMAWLGLLGLGGLMLAVRRKRG